MNFNKQIILLFSLSFFSKLLAPENQVKACSKELVNDRYFLVLKKYVPTGILDHPTFIVRKKVENVSTTYYSFGFTAGESSDEKNYFLSVDPSIASGDLMSLKFSQVTDKTKIPDEALWILDGTSFDLCGFKNLKYKGFLSFKDNENRPKIDLLGFSPRNGLTREFNFVYQEDKYSTYVGAKQHERFDRIGRLLLGTNSANKFNENSQESISVSLEELIDITDSILKNMYSIDSVTKRWLVTAGGVETDSMWKDSDKNALKVRDIDTVGRYQVSDFLMLIGTNSSYIEQFNYSMDLRPNQELLQKAKDNVFRLSVNASNAILQLKEANRAVCYGDKIKLLNTASWKHLFSRAGTHSKFPALNSQSGIVVFSSDYNSVYDRFGLEEEESWWIIRSGGESKYSKKGSPVKFGDSIKLENVFNGQSLLSTTKKAKFNLNTNDASSWEDVDLVFIGDKTQTNLQALSDVWTINSGTGVQAGSPVVVGDIFSLVSGTKNLAFSDFRKFYFSSGGETYDNLINFAFLIPAASADNADILWTIESQEKAINYPFGSVAWLDKSIKTFDSANIDRHTFKISGFEKGTGLVSFDKVSTVVEPLACIMPLFDFKTDDEVVASNTVESKNQSDLEIDIKKSFIMRSQLGASNVTEAQAKGIFGTILSYVTGGLSDSIYKGYFPGASGDGQTADLFKNVGDFSNSPGIIQFSPCDTKNIYEEFKYDSWDQSETVRFSKKTTPGFYVVADWPKILGTRFLTLSRNKPLSDSDGEFENLEKLSKDMYKAIGFRVNRYHADKGNVYTADAFSGQRDDYDADFTLRRYKKVDDIEEAIVCPDEFRNEFVNGTLGSGVDYQASDWPGISTLDIKTPYSLADMLTIISRIYTHRKLSKDPAVIRKSLEIEKAFASDAQKALARIYTFYFGGIGGTTFNNSNFFTFDTFKNIENKAFTSKESSLFNDQLINTLKQPLKYGDLIKILSYKTWRHIYGKAEPINDFDLSGKFNQGFPFLFSDYSFLSDKLGFMELQSWWIIKGPHDKSLFLGKRAQPVAPISASYQVDVKVGDPVKNNDVIRLENALTGKNLHLTSNEAIFYKKLGKSYVVSIYGNSGQGDGSDNFKIKIQANPLDIDANNDSKEFVVLLDKTPRNLSDSDLHIGSVFELVGENEIDGKRVELFADHECTLTPKSGLFEGLETIVGLPESSVVDKKCVYWSIDSFKRNWATAAG